jgi:hypothetical protein
MPVGESNGNQVLANGDQGFANDHNDNWVTKIWTKFWFMLTKFLENGRRGLAKDHSMP